MKLRELTQKMPTEHASRSRRRVRQYMEEHPDEVFTQHNEELAAALGYHPNTIAVSIWELYQRRLIDRERVNKKYYYGGHKAIKALREQVDTSGETKTRRQKALERIDEIREKIWEREGRIDTLELLEAARRAEGLL